MNLKSAEGAKMSNYLDQLRYCAMSNGFRAFSAKITLASLPGPLAQAFTFRAFGAVARFSHSLYRAGFCKVANRKLNHYSIVSRL